LIRLLLTLCEIVEKQKLKDYSLQKPAIHAGEQLLNEFFRINKHAFDKESLNEAQKEEYEQTCAQIGIKMLAEFKDIFFETDCIRFSYKDIKSNINLKLPQFEKILRIFRRSYICTQSIESRLIPHFKENIANCIRTEDSSGSKNILKIF
jgi:hypothetical protein